MAIECVRLGHCRRAADANGDALTADAGWRGKALIELHQSTEPALRLILVGSIDRTACSLLNLDDLAVWTGNLDAFPIEIFIHGD